MLPALVRHLIYPVHERLLNRPTFAFFGALEQSQWLSRTAIESLQRERLGELLRTAAEHSPWHRERINAAGIDFSSRDSFGWEDFRRLPTMNKADATAHRERLVWRSAPGGVFQYTTGGSSGQPLIFYFGRKRQAADQAGRLRARHWWGVNVGDPEVYLWGAPVELSKTDRIKTIRDRLFNQLVLNAFAMSPARMDAYLEAIERFQPSCIYGYASSVALLAAHGQARGRKLQLPGLKVVCTTGEPLYPDQRSLIGEYFHVPVANEYGCRDGGFVAHEAPSGEMLVTSEFIIVEILDPQGQPVSPGETGEIVLTNLASEAQPFIRYRTGDIGRMLPDGSKTGCGLHVLGAVEGRQTDFLVRRDGTIMHALAGIYVLRAIPGVKEFRITQNALEHVAVEVVSGTEWQPEHAQRIVAELKQRLGESVTIDVQLREQIAPERSGKHRYVVSHVPLPAQVDLSSSQTL